MVTELRRTIIRRTTGSFDHRKRRLIVRLEIGDVISVKEERSHKWFTAPINHVYQQIVHWNVQAEKAMKKLRRKP